jgi:hypothetical protein
MKRTLIGTAIAMLLVAPGIADAKCVPRDLTGLWDLYFTLGPDAYQCQGQQIRDGAFDGACIIWFNLQDSDGDSFAGQLELSKFCSLSGEVTLGNTPCGIEATMYRSKGMASGVMHCGFDGDPTAAPFAALFTMIQRHGGG